MENELFAAKDRTAKNQIESLQKIQFYAQRFPSLQPGHRSARRDKSFT
jgi:hypothetical protein